MPAMSLTPSALKAYLAGRKAAELMSVDPQTAAVPPEFTSEEKAYRLGLTEEQQGVPLPQQPPASQAAPPVPPVAAPPSPAPSPRVPAAPERIRNEFRNFLVKLKLQPVDVIRAVAVEQIVRIDKAMGDAPLLTRFWRLDYTGIKGRLANARARLDAGDRLKDFPDEDSKAERRNAYVAAYNVAFTEGENLASTTSDEYFLVLSLSAVAEAAKKAATAYVDTVKDVAHSGEAAVGKVVDLYAAGGKAVLQAGQSVGGYAAKKVDEVGSTVKTVAYVAAGGLAIGLIVFAFKKGSSGERRSRRADPSPRAPSMRRR